MRRYSFLQVDAFTTQPLEGNPCAVFFDTDDLDETTMLKIAREMNLSESAFLRRSTTADFAARYFTPAEEIPLAGHPTIAASYALVSTGRLMLQEDHTRFMLELKVGPIPVDIDARQGKITRIMMTQKQPLFLNVYPLEQVLPVFGLDEDDLIPGVPIQTVSTGTPQLMLPLKTPEALRRAQLDPSAYASLRAAADFFSPHLFCLGGATSQGRTFARHFGVPPDTMEDPFTGSATGGMAAYLWHYQLIDSPTFIAEQGHWMGRPGQAAVEVIGSPENIETVRVGGPAVEVLRGEILL